MGIVIVISSGFPYISSTFHSLFFLCTQCMMAMGVEELGVTLETTISASMIEKVHQLGEKFVFVWCIYLEVLGKGERMTERT